MRKIVSKVYNNSKYFIEENKAGIFVTFMMIGAVYYVLMQIGIATHDELTAIAKAQTEGLELKLESRWGWSIYIIPLYLQSSAGCYFIYRLYTLAGLMIACGGMSAILFHHFDKKLAWSFPILFFLLATMNMEHDGLYAFGWSYQFSIGFIFLSLDLYLFYLKKEKKIYKIFSSFFYFLGMAAYEAFVPFGVVFFCVACYCRYNQKCLSLKKLIQDLALHAMLAIFYTISFFAVAKIFFAGDAGDAQISTGASIAERIRTCWDFSWSLFPLKLYYQQGELAELVDRVTELTSANMLRWGAIFFFAVFFTWFLAGVKKRLEARLYIFITITCLTGMILPNAVLVLNSKFVDWHSEGTRSFGTAYYSYFFITLWIGVTLLLLYQRIPWKTFNSCIICMLLTITAGLVMAGNQDTIRALHTLENRYETFAEFIQTEEYANTEKGAVIYTENLQGIHNDIKRNEDYADDIAGTSTAWTKDKDAIDFSRPVYMLRYDANASAIYYGKIDAMWNTDRIYIYQHEPDSYGIKVRRTGGGDIGKAAVNGKCYGHYAANVITGTINEASAETSVECKDMDMRTFSILHGTSGIDTDIIHLCGFYELESWGRWVQKESRIEIDNIWHADHCTLKFNLLAHDTGSIHIRNGTYQTDIEVSTEYREFVVKVPLTQGLNTIEFHSDTADLDIDTDLRDINWGTAYFNIICGRDVIALAYEQQ